MVKVSYKDVIILLLVVSQVFLIFHIVTSKDDNSPGDSYFYLNDDNGNRELRDVKVNTSKNFSEDNITDNRSEYRELKDSNSVNEGYNSVNNRSSYRGINNFSINERYNNNTWYSRKNTSVKNVSLNELFLDLSYSNVIPISENGKKGIVKIYKKDGRIIYFDVRNYKLELDNPRNLNVSKEKRLFKYGIYYRYKYTVQYGNNTSEDYCYYRKVGNYHIIMGFDKEDEFVRDMWLRWNEYIESVLYQ